MQHGGLFGRQHHIESCHLTWSAADGLEVVWSLHAQTQTRSWQL